MDTARAASRLISDMPHDIPGTMNILFHLVIILDGIWRPLWEVEAVPVVLVVINQHGDTPSIRRYSLERVDEVLIGETPIEALWKVRTELIHVTQSNKRTDRRRPQDVRVNARDNRCSKQSRSHQT